MPGPVSDSFDSEFGTAANAQEVIDALLKLRQEITEAIGTEDLLYILDVVRREDMVFQDVSLLEKELRLIRFAIDRALETI